MNSVRNFLDDSRVVVIVTGGMAMQSFDKAQGCCVPSKNSKEIIESIGHEINLDKLEIVEFSVLDSSTIDLDFLHDLAKLVQRKINIENVNGVVIIHGSDTMEITAYFLHRCIYPNMKPIVLTGSMRVISSSDYDGKANITNAIRQVIDPGSSRNGFGVSINFAGKIHSPINVAKDHSFAIDPFSSGSFGVLGMMHTNRIDWLNNPKKTSIIPLPDKLTSVPIVYAFPGATENFLDGFISKFKGVVIVAYGSGNVSDQMYLAVKKLVENGLKVVLVTNCKYGGVFTEYGGVGGNQSLRELGVIMANDLNAYQAMIVGSLIFDNNIIPKDFLIHNYFNNKFFM